MWWNNSPYFIFDCNPVFHHGEFYCLGQHGNLGVFNPDENYWRVLDKPHRQPEPCDPFLSHKRNFLVECNGELLLVSMSFIGRSISVSKLDSVEMMSHKVDSLGDQMLYVSNASSLSAIRVVQGMENKIYLPKIHGKCKSWGGLIEHKNFASWRLDIFKLDLSVLEWVKVESLGDHTFFINEDANCISCSSTKSGTLGNSIYIMQHDDESMYVFDIEEMRIYTHHPSPYLGRNVAQK
ncbi:hypothetical protein RHSIM_Rhsim01G0008700 [Rhododendron simsii]|uniref:KIB1-4 beta-propeller domain-containing protein n=1 Tax=Rhododendron simsii TaxID=118357 RepID=A0A834HDX6_RHOSS|nr:hypothetical protein RHSIM_Rhsim01G0008700 [Rhododendron simsii]